MIIILNWIAKVYFRHTQKFRSYSCRVIRMQSILLVHLNAGTQEIQFITNSFDYFSYWIEWFIRYSGTQANQIRFPTHWWTCDFVRFGYLYCYVSAMKSKSWRQQYIHRLTMNMPDILERTVQKFRKTLQFETFEWNLRLLKALIAMQWPA